MSKEKTALSQGIEKIESRMNEYPKDGYEMSFNDGLNHAMFILQELLELEKQQIKQAFHDGQNNGTIDCENYFINKYEKP